MLNKLDKVIGCIVKAEQKVEGVKIQYKDPLNHAKRQLSLSNGETDLNDLDEFLEAVVSTYRIGALTRPELELLQCLVYGLCSQYLQAEGSKNPITLTEDIELAYQDTLKISVWMRRLFSCNHQNQAILSFDVNDKAEVQLVYRRTGSKNVPGVFGYVGIVIAQDRFDYDSFVAFCASTHAPLPGMDIHTAQSIHHLLCQNILFLLNRDVVAGEPVFKFNGMEKHHA